MMQWPHGPRVCLSCPCCRERAYAMAAWPRMRAWAGTHLSSRRYLVSLNQHIPPASKLTLILIMNQIPHLAVALTPTLKVVWHLNPDCGHELCRQVAEQLDAEIREKIATSFSAA